MAAKRKVDGCPFSWRPQEKRAGTGAGGGERKRPSRIPISTKYEIRKFLFRGGRDLRGNAISPALSPFSSLRIVASSRS